MKLKNLRKKVRRLETRLKEGPKKLARLKRKLDAIAAAKARKAQKKAAARAVARQTPNSSTPIKKKKVKRKLNLSPERRAQLAAAMKARWAAKRAALGAKPQSALIAQEIALGEVPPSP